uniref:BZIP domain-containing protein n=1 Tax=Syphacia muris TaxID=451379 RepID=A0A0N5AMJ2_9BILA
MGRERKRRSRRSSVSVEYWRHKRPRNSSERHRRNESRNERARRRSRDKKNSMRNTGWQEAGLVSAFL